jgi:hypothetical protein
MLEEYAENQLCATCKSKVYDPARCGSAVIEITLWVYCIFPALAYWIFFGSIIISIAIAVGMSIPSVVYSLWRRTGKFGRCPICNSENIMVAGTKESTDGHY